MLTHYENAEDRLHLEVYFLLPPISYFRSIRFKDELSNLPIGHNQLLTQIVNLIELPQH